MDHRRIGARDPVGQRHEARAPLLGELHQADDLGEQGALADRPDLHPQRRPEIDRAREHAVAGRDPLRQRFAGDQAGVELAGARTHQAVGPDPLAGRDQDLLPGIELLRPTLRTEPSGRTRLTDAALSASRRSAAERALPRARWSR